MELGVAHLDLSGERKEGRRKRDEGISPDRHCTAVCTSARGAEEEEEAGLSRRREGRDAGGASGEASS